MTASIPPGAIGFRLAHELEGILLGIRADGVIHDLERDRLERWAAVNAPCIGLRPFTELKTRIDEALSDGVLSVDEVDDLLFVTQKFTTVNPYFSALRAGIQTMLGVLAGVAADGVVKPDELRAIASWSDDWRHLAGLWPFDEVVALVTRLHAGNATAAECYAKVRELVDTFPLSGEYEGSWAPPIIQGLCAIDPVIEFENRMFVFTGESPRGTRSDLASFVLERGAVVHDRITKKVNYVVVCDNGNPHWAFSCYGRKVEEAYKLRRQGHSLVLVHEIDFWDAVGV